MRESRALPALAVQPEPAAHSNASGEFFARLAFVRDPMRIALFILTTVTVSRVHQHYPFVAKLRPALLITMAAAAYAWMHPNYLSKRNVLKLWPMRRVAIMGVVACLSAVFGISLGNSGKFILESYGKTLVYAFLFVLTIRHVRDLYTYIWSFVISCGILSYFAIFVFKITKGNSAVTRLSDLYTYDANDLGLVIIVGMAFTLLLLQVTKGRHRLALVAILIAETISIARSGSRGAFLGLVATGGVGLVLINSISAGKRVAIVSFALIALVIAAPPGYWEQMRTMSKPTEDYNLTTTDGRVELIKRGLRYTAQYPVFGLGIGNFSKAECTLSADKAEASGHLRCGAPHNSFIQSLSETGVVGFVVWTSILLTGIRSMLKLRRRLPKHWRTGTEVERFLYACTHFNVIAIVGFMVTSFFLSFAWMDIYYILAVFMSGTLVATKVQLAASQAPSEAVAPVPVGRGARGRQGWRVAQSALRFAAWVPAVGAGTPEER